MWGDGGQSGALEGGSHPRTTAHSCPPGPAKGLGHLTGSVQIQISLLLPPSHTFLSDPLSPYLPASFPPPHWGPLGRGLGSHRAKSQRSLTRTDFPPLTSVERRDAQNTQDAIFSWEHIHTTPVYSAKVDFVINIMMLWCIQIYMYVYKCMYICIHP